MSLAVRGDHDIAEGVTDAAQVVVEPDFGAGLDALHSDQTHCKAWRGGWDANAWELMTEEKKEMG